MHALQRVHRSRSIGLLCVQLTSNAPSQPRMSVTLPECTAIVRCCGSVPPPCNSRLTSSLSASICAARVARSAAPITSTLPFDS